MTHHTQEKIKKLIDFDDNQIAKKILAENGDNKALLIALKKGQSMPEHESPVNAFVYIIDGEVEFDFPEVSPCEHVIKEDEIFFFNAGETHSVKAKKDTKMLVVKI